MPAAVPTDAAIQGVDFVSPSRSYDNRFASLPIAAMAIGTLAANPPHTIVPAFLVVVAGGGLFKLLYQIGEAVGQTAKLQPDDASVSAQVTRVKATVGCVLMAPLLLAMVLGTPVAALVVSITPCWGEYNTIENCAALPISMAIGAPLLELTLVPVNARVWAAARRLAAAPAPGGLRARLVGGGVLCSVIVIAMGIALFAMRLKEAGEPNNDEMAEWGSWGVANGAFVVAAGLFAGEMLRRRVHGRLPEPDRAQVALCALAIAAVCFGLLLKELCPLPEHTGSSINCKDEKEDALGLGGAAAAALLWVLMVLGNPASAPSVPPVAVAGAEEL